MTTPIIIKYRKFEKCPVSAERREIVGHVSAFHSTFSGSHHFMHHCIGMISEVVLRRMDGGEMLGSYSENDTTVVWDTKK